MRKLTLCVLLAAPLAAPLTAQAQPTALTAVHRSGQTFLSWKENSVVAGESYKVYRHTAPITSATLAMATRIETVTEASSVAFTDRLDVGSGPQKRYIDTFVIQDQGPELGAGVGMLVWTLGLADFASGSSGAGHYAVTIVNSAGVENTALGTGNTFGALDESMASPSPVLVKRDTTGRASLYLQFMDLRDWNASFHAPNPINNHYGQNPATTPGAIQYGYTYSVHEPDAAIAPGNGPFPLVVDLHQYDGPAGVMPIIPWPLEPAMVVLPYDVGNTWWFGFEESTDYRTGVPIGQSTERAVNFTEYRVLRMIHDLLRDPHHGPRIDRNRIYVRGFSMGASGTLSLAMRYPDVFAAAYANKPVTDYTTMAPTPFLNHEVELWAPITADIPVRIKTVGSWGCALTNRAGLLGVWAWQNHQLGLTRDRRHEIVPLGLNHGRADTIISLQGNGLPAYASLEASDRCYGAIVLNQAHSNNTLAGMPPALSHSGTAAQFQGYRIRLDETVPGLANATSNVPGVSFNQTVEWAASWSGWGVPPVDTPSTWQMDFRVPASSPGVDVDVTPRRTQQFHTTPGAIYDWQCIDLQASSQTSGQVTAGNDGLVTVNVRVRAGGTRLRITRQSPYTLSIPPLSLPGPHQASLLGCRPNSAQALLVSVAGRDVVDFGIVMVNLCEAITHGFSTADPGGRATFQIQLSSQQAGVRFWYQAVGYDATGAPRSTNVVVREVQ